MGTSFCFTYSWVNPLSSGKGIFHGRPQHRGDSYLFYFKRGGQFVLWYGYHKFEDRRGIGNAQEGRLGNMGAEDDGAYKLALPFVSGGDVG